MNVATARVAADDPRFMGGTWYPFPPPGPGTYDLRRVQIPIGRSIEDAEWHLWLARPLVTQREREYILAQRVDKMRAVDGWQFRFPQGRQNWRPMAVTYDFVNGAPRVREKSDITGQLPLARSIEEARYIVRMIPYLWPAFWHIHIEYTEEVLQ